MRRRTLLTQVLVANLLVICAGVAAATIAADSGRLAGWIVLAAAVALTVAVNVFLLQRRFRPLERLIDEMERADLSRPRANLGGATDGRAETEEVARLELAFRRMLERLEAERRRAASAALEAQEDERARVARDLHDEVNQSLTGLLLHLEAARREAPPALVPELSETKSVANRAMDELLSVARQLRPTALDDLGLAAALAAHTDEVGRLTGVATRFEPDGELSKLDAEAQLVIYRVAQEAISNATRHAGADHVDVRLTRTGHRVELVVSDDGRGFSFDEAEGGLGIPGMRERALLAGGELEIQSRPGTGTTVRLVIP
ncbi:MAG TPA: sensor histidine kinase [Patescibacteria group bacterium]|nr:sensor histidine kinase [Patescibacteria group bacterium]